MDSHILGQKIRQARENRGLSQRELAEALSIGQRGVSELENGNRKLAVSELPVLCSTLGVSLLYLLEDELQQDDLDHLLLTQFHRIESDDLRKTVIEIVGLLVGSLSR